MKKTLLCALAILLACAVATPASAQYHRPGSHPGYRNDGYRIPIPQIEIRGDYGDYRYDRGDSRYRGYDTRDRYNRPGYGYSYSRYGRRFSRNEAIGAAAVIGGGLLINAVAERHREAEEPSKCFERVIKNARKQRVELDASDAMAFCGGQLMQRPTVMRRVSDDDDAVFINCTHGKVFVGNPETGEGFYLNPGERGNAAASSPAYGKFDEQFRQARIVWLGNTAQITAPEEK